MLQKLFNPEWQNTLKSFLLSSFLIGFSFLPTAEISRLELEFEESLPGKTASKRGLDRSQMEQPIKKNKFSFFARSRLRLSSTRDLGTRLIPGCTLQYFSILQHAYLARLIILPLIISWLTKRTTSVFVRQLFYHLKDYNR